MSKSIVSSGLRSSGTVISSGMSMYVLSGGSLTSASVNSGGKLYVSNGGDALNTSLGAGGYLRVGLGGWLIQLWLLLPEPNWILRGPPTISVQVLRRSMSVSQ